MEPGEHKHCYQDDDYPQQWMSQDAHRNIIKHIYNSLVSFASVALWNIFRIRPILTCVRAPIFYPAYA
jgi:hypothetical protein